MKDQFDNDVPNDLVVLSGENPADMTLEMLEAVDRADWYEVDGVLLVSAAAVPGLESDPLDSGITLTETTEVLYVGHILKRWNEIDGFYHA